MPLYYTSRSADVYPYHEKHMPLENVLIVTGATAFDHPDGNKAVEAKNFLR